MTTCTSGLLFGAGGSPADEYFLLADFAAYCQAEQRMAETYRDQTAWNRMSLHNIARSGVFAADRAVAEYAGQHLARAPQVSTRLTPRETADPLRGVFFCGG